MSGVDTLSCGSYCGDVRSFGWITKANTNSRGSLINQYNTGLVFDDLVNVA